ncbi:MAG: hypothetical protein ACOCXH_10650 [Cyclobacteriaceae bacterium]
MGELIFFGIKTLPGFQTLVGFFDKQVSQSVRTGFGEITIFILIKDILLSGKRRSYRCPFLPLCYLAPVGPDCSGGVILMVIRLKVCHITTQGSALGVNQHNTPGCKPERARRNLCQPNKLVGKGIDFPRVGVFFKPW